MLSDDGLSVAGSRDFSFANWAVAVVLESGMPPMPSVPSRSSAGSLCGSVAGGGTSIVSIIALN